MIRALWTATTGMEAQQLDQDVVANNLANVNTVGFKRSRTDFQDLMYQIEKKAGAQTSGGVQLPVGIEMGLGTKLTAVQKLFSQGDYQRTGNQLDMAIEGNGFFQLDDGGRTVYTRAGNFKVNRDGVITNSEGLKLLPEITLPEGTTTFTVDNGGTWTATDKLGQILATGRIELAIFPNPAGLASLGRNLYDRTEASGEAVVGNPGEGGIGGISQHFLEMSNVNVIEELVRMIVGQRAYEINSKAIQTADNMLQTITNLKR